MIFKMTHIALIATVAGALPGEGSRAATPDGDPASRLVAVPPLDHGVERNRGGDWVELAQAQNRPPRVRQTILDPTFKEGTEFTFPIPTGATFRDPDGDQLFYTIRENVDWMTRSGTTLIGKPAAFDAPARVTVRARDRRNPQDALSVETTFRVRIEPLKGKGGKSANVPNDNGSPSDIIPAISANGRFVAQVFQGFNFSDSGSFFVEGINVRDTARDDDMLWTVFREEVSSEETLEGQFVSSPAISANGRIVALVETAGSELSRESRVRVLRIADADPLDVDLLRTFRAGLASIRENAREAVVSLSGDGRFVAFERGEDVAVAKLAQGKPLVIDTGSNPSISRTGRRVAYQRATRVVTATLDTETMEVIGTTVIGPGSNPAVSANGRFVAFESGASDLVPCDTNGASDIFVYDHRNRTIARASVDADGDQADDGFFSNASLSADGSLIAFDFEESQVLVRRLDEQGKPRGRLRNASILAGDGLAAQPALSANGRFVAFTIDLDDGDFTVFSVPAFSHDAPEVDFPIDPSAVTCSALSLRRPRRLFRVEFGQRWERRERSRWLQWRESWRIS